MGERENKNCYLSVFLVVPQSRVSVRMYIGNRVFFFSSLLGDDSIVNLTIVFFFMCPLLHSEFPHLRREGKGKNAPPPSSSSSSEEPSPPLPPPPRRQSECWTAAQDSFAPSLSGMSKRAKLHLRRMQNLGTKAILMFYNVQNVLKTRANCAIEMQSKKERLKNPFSPKKGAKENP